MAKILSLVLDKPQRGGAYRPYVLQALREAGYRPLIILLEGEPAECPLYKHFPVISLRLTPQAYRRFRPQTLSLFRKTLRKNAVQLIWVQRFRPWFHLSLIKRVYKERFGLLFHVVNVGYFRRFWRKQSLRFLASQTDLWIGNSPEVKTDLDSTGLIPSSRLRVIWNGVDLKRFVPCYSRPEARRRFGIPENEFVVGMVARFRKEKDQEGLIEAVANLKTQGLKIYLVLAGGGPKEKALRDLAARRGIQNQVQFFSWVPREEVPYLLRAFDVFAHPSWKEGMPNAVLEAMASSLPVVATDAPGVPVIFDTPQKIGFLVPKGSPEALGRALAELYFMPPSERENLGRAARARIKEAFSIEKMCQRFVGAFRELESGFEGSVS